MSAFADLQEAISEYLGRRAAGTIGNGAERELRFVHDLDTDVLTVKVAAGDTELVPGVDFDVQVVDLNQLVFKVRTASVPAAGAWAVTCGVLRTEVPTVKRRDFTGRGVELKDQIAQAVANRGLCINVLPPLPQSATQGTAFVFFKRAEVRVRIIEKPAISRRYGCDVFDLIDDVATALNWRHFPMLAHPLQIAPRPVEIFGEAVEDRAFDVVFHATYGISRKLPPAT